MIMQQLFNKTQSHRCEYTSPLSILVWCFLVDHGAVVVEDHPLDSLRFYYGKNYKIHAAWLIDMIFTILWTKKGYHSRI